jgi:formate dehydrogenase subunit gamma
MTVMRKISRAAMVALAVLFAGSLGGDTISFSLDRQARAQTAAAPAAPGKSDDWRAVRQGQTGYVSIPDKQAGRLIQSGGENWRNWRNGPISVWGGWAMLGTIALLALFFAVRGRIRIEHGASGRRVERFNDVERFAHWLTAVSFIVLALSGLNILYGRYVLRPIIGADAFAALSSLGKYLHNYVAFAFMAGIVLILALWVRHNIPTREDLAWLAKGGGLFAKGVHPAARKFNAGQKILYWLVVLGGISLSLSGIALLWPFEVALFAPTFKFLNIFGFGLPADLTSMQEVQLSQMWHAVVALILIAVTIGHIYLGTVGMEGAFDAMGTGMVDENWAREHHSLWAAEMSGGKKG